MNRNLTFDQIREFILLIIYFLIQNQALTFVCQMFLQKMTIEVGMLWTSKQKCYSLVTGNYPAIIRLFKDLLFVYNGRDT